MKLKIQKSLYGTKEIQEMKPQAYAWGYFLLFNRLEL